FWSDMILLSFRVYRLKWVGWIERVLLVGSVVRVMSIRAEHRPVVGWRCHEKWFGFNAIVLLFDSITFNSFWHIRRADLHEIFQREQAHLTLGQVLDLLHGRIHVVDANGRSAIPQLAVDELPGNQHCLTVSRRISFTADDLEVAD